MMTGSIIVGIYCVAGGFLLGIVDYNHAYGADLFDVLAFILIVLFWPIFIAHAVGKKIYDR
jgi:hypothetical protein